MRGDVLTLHRHLIDTATGKDSEVVLAGELVVHSLLGELERKPIRTRELDARHEAQQVVTEVIRVLKKQWGTTPTERPYQAFEVARGWIRHLSHRISGVGADLVNS